MDAGSLNCPDCGAAVPANSTECTFCHARLATIGCPKCYGLVFVGSKHCQHCGADVGRPADRDATPLACPRKCGPLRPVRFGGADMYLCEKCNGLWVDPDTLQRIIADRLKPAPMLATGIALPTPEHGKLDTVQYAPCPVCKTLMNRVNFAHASGVIVDVCTNHGTWFDAEELRRVLEFITAGGLEAARAREFRQTQTPAASSMPDVDDPWKLMRPLLETKDGATIVRALVSFAGRNKVLPKPGD